MLEYKIALGRRARIRYMTEHLPTNPGKTLTRYIDYTNETKAVQEKREKRFYQDILPLKPGFLAPPGPPLYNSIFCHFRFEKERIEGFSLNGQTQILRFPILKTFQTLKPNTIVFWLTDDCRV